MENLAVAIHMCVSNARDLVEAMDVLLERGNEAYAIPRDAIEAIRMVMDTNATLVAKLYEENQKMVDNAEKLAKNAGVVAMLKALVIEEMNDKAIPPPGEGCKGSGER